MTKKQSLTLEEENEERKKYAGVTKEELDAAANAIRAQKTKAATASGDLSAKLEIFEKANGVKKSIKLATWLADQDPKVAQDFLRTLNGYCTGLGVFDQIDMWDQEQKGKANEASIKRASKPQAGEEPAEAFH